MVKLRRICQMVKLRRICQMVKLRRARQMLADIHEHVLALRAFQTALRIEPLSPPPPNPPPPRTKWTRRVPHLVLIGHAASLTPY
jgi:hypothetical protein